MDLKLLGLRPIDPNFQPVPSTRSMNWPIVRSCAFRYYHHLRGMLVAVTRFRILQEAANTCKSTITVRLLTVPRFARSGYGARGTSAPGISEKRLLLSAA
jgi:hypothetical protein